MIVKLFHLPQHGMERIHEPISHRYIALFQHCLRYYAFRTQSPRVLVAAGGCRKNAESVSVIMGIAC